MMPATRFPTGIRTWGVAGSSREDDAAQDGDVTTAHGQGWVVSQPEVTLSLRLFFLL